MGQPEVQYLEVAGRSIAYRHRMTGGRTLFFLPGYGSDMEGNKALALDAFAEEGGLSLLRLDYSGTGSSAGRFEDGTLGQWLEEVVAVADKVTAEPLLVIGSSMGGWLALHFALRKADRVKALVGIAAAPDFTNWGFVDGDDAASKGLARGFWESGQKLLLLDQSIGIDCPVRLLHGELDQDVPLEVAFRTMRALRSADVQLLVLKGGGHRLSEPHEIDAILRTVTALLEQIS